MTVEGMTGAHDARVVEASRRGNRVFFTLDKGLDDIRRFPPLRHRGVVLFKVNQKGRGEVRRGVLAAMPHVTGKAASGRLLVVTPRSLRVR